MLLATSCALCPPLLAAGVFLNAAVPPAPRPTPTPTGPVLFNERAKKLQTPTLIYRTSEGLTVILELSAATLGRTVVPPADFAVTLAGVDLGSGLAAAVPSSVTTKVEESSIVADSAENTNVSPTQARSGLTAKLRYLRNGLGPFSRQIRLRRVDDLDAAHWAQSFNYKTSTTTHNLELPCRRACEALQSTRELQTQKPCKDLLVLPCPGVVRFSSAPLASPNPPMATSLTANTSARSLHPNKRLRISGSKPLNVPELLASVFGASARGVTSVCKCADTVPGAVAMTAGGVPFISASVKRSPQTACTHLQSGFTSHCSDISSSRPCKSQTLTSACTFAFPFPSSPFAFKPNANIC